MASSNSNDSDTSIIDHNYITKSRYLAGANDPRICYISTSEDLRCLNSASGGVIKRILRTTDQIEVPAKYGLLIQTQIFHPGNSEKWFVTDAMLSSSIKTLDDYWLARETESQIVIREGEISPKFSGKIQVAVFNKSDEGIIIKKNSAIAVLVTSLYPYMTSSPPKYSLF